MDGAAREVVNMKKSLLGGIKAPDLPKKVDGVIEAVRYAPDGQLALARVYRRRGPTWSDRVLVTREELVHCLKNRKKVVIGRRIPYMASTFEIISQVQLVQSGGGEILVTGSSQAEHDALTEAPLF